MVSHYEHTRLTSGPLEAHILSTAPVVADSALLWNQQAEFAAALSGADGAVIVRLTHPLVQGVLGQYPSTQSPIPESLPSWMDPLWAALAEAEDGAVVYEDTRSHPDFAELAPRNPPIYGVAAIRLPNRGEHHEAVVVWSHHEPGFGENTNLRPILRHVAEQIALIRNLTQQTDQLETQRQARTKALESAFWQARHDTLTGLPNRALFLERLTAALDSLTESGKARNRNTESLAVLFIDLNRFKQINDTLGHAAGDILLREVAGRFADCLQAGDTLARMGGDEFTVLLPEIPNAEYAEKVAQMLLHTLRRPITLNTQEYQVGASIGISFFPRDGKDTHTLLQNADIAMYKAKERGGIRAYSQKMNAHSHRQLLQETELRRAIERDEVTVCYQPIIEVSSGKIVSVEALARWQHNRWGQVSPVSFIELAEHADLVVPLGHLVLRHACEDAAWWRQESPEARRIRVAVNLSSRQVADPVLVDTIRELLTHFNLPGDALDIELTETALCTTGDGTPDKLCALRAMGIRLFVDDFGTGYSSLAYLRRFPVDGVKIDHSFVAGIGREAADEAIVCAIADLTEALGVRLIAEGVETKYQAAFLREICCDMAQGYLFGKAEDRETMLLRFKHQR
ncbi:MAG: hypothetical protein OHK0029_11540 [Armatimonadaceae bacterium]